MDNLAVLIGSSFALITSSFAIGCIISQWLREPAALPSLHQDELEEINPYDHLFDKENT